MTEITLWPFRNIPEAAVQETYCQEMLLTIFIGLLAKTEPCSLNAWLAVDLRVSDSWLLTTRGGYC